MVQMDSSFTIVARSVMWASFALLVTLLGILLLCMLSMGRRRYLATPRITLRTVKRKGDDVNSLSSTEPSLQHQEEVVEYSHQVSMQNDKAAT